MISVCIALRVPVVVVALTGQHLVLVMLDGSLTEAEMGKLLAAMKANRHGHRDWLIGLLIFRHGLRVSEACDLRWDDIDLGKRTIAVRRLKLARGQALLAVAFLAVVFP